MGRINLRLLSTTEKVWVSPMGWYSPETVCRRVPEVGIIIITLLCSVVGWRLPGRHMVPAGKLRLKAFLWKFLS